jgi:hypothetical protein
LEFLRCKNSIGIGNSGIHAAKKIIGATYGRTVEGYQTEDSGHEENRVDVVYQH